MKKILLGVMFFMLLFSLDKTTYAKNIYYMNKNGVVFSSEEYIFLNKMYWEGCQDLFNKDDYKRFVDSNMINGELKIVNFNAISPLDTSHTTNYKQLKIASSCTDICYISTTVNWLKSPSTRSYDVIGARLENTELLKTPETVLFYSDNSYNSYASDEIQKFSNGFGVSIKLPTNGTEIKINQTFTVRKNGMIYASYQHAQKSISLENSKNYIISSSGYGSVFKFNGSATNVYDQMGGVNIEV